MNLHAVVCDGNGWRSSRNLRQLVGREDARWKVSRTKELREVMPEAISEAEKRLVRARRGLIEGMRTALIGIVLGLIAHFLAFSRNRGLVSWVGAVYLLGLPMVACAVLAVRRHAAGAKEARRRMRECRDTLAECGIEQAEAESVLEAPVEQLPEL